MSETFTHNRSVQFAETDMAGVLHFSNYLRYMEEAEHAFWRSLGLSVYMIDRAEHVSWPRVAVSCDYKSPARFDDALELRVSIVKLGSRSLTFQIDFERDGEHLARGTMTTVCCAMSQGSFRAVTIPAAIREKLDAHAGVTQGTRDED